MGRFHREVGLRGRKRPCLLAETGRLVQIGPSVLAELLKPPITFLNLKPDLPTDLPVGHSTVLHPLLDAACRGAIPLCDLALSCEAHCWFSWIFDEVLFVAGALPARPETPRTRFRLRQPGVQNAIPPPAGLLAHEQPDSDRRQCSPSLHDCKSKRALNQPPRLATPQHPSAQWAQWQTTRSPRGESRLDRRTI